MAYLLFLLTALSLHANEVDYRRSVITDPSISRRCEKLLQKRKRKLNHKQKLQGLIRRNENLQKSAPRERQTLIKKLEKNLGQLKQELKITLLEIENQEENIIRKGCPGVTL